MAIKIEKAFKKELYLVSGNGIIRTVLYKDKKGFIAYRKTDSGDFELKPEGEMLNEEIALAFTNSLTIEITESDYYNKTSGELHEMYNKQNKI